MRVTIEAGNMLTYGCVSSISMPYIHITFEGIFYTENTGIRMLLEKTLYHGTVIKVEDHGAIIKFHGLVNAEN